MFRSSNRGNCVIDSTASNELIDAVPTGPSGGPPRPAGPQGSPGEVTQMEAFAAWVETLRAALSR